MTKYATMRARIARSRRPMHPAGSSRPPGARYDLAGSVPIGESGDAAFALGSREMAGDFWGGVGTIDRGRDSPGRRVEGPLSGALPPPEAAVAETPRRLPRARPSRL